MRLANFTRLPDDTFGNRAGQETITCGIGHGSDLVFGTSAGVVLRLCALTLRVTELVRHDGSIAAVALDDSNSWVASSFSKGTISVDRINQNGTNAGSTAAHLRRNWIEHHGFPILALAFCPGYSSGSLASCAICVGGEEGKLIMTRRGSLGSRSAVLHNGTKEGAITDVKWHEFGRLVAWANGKGVKVIDVQTRQKVTHVPHPYHDHGSCLNAGHLVQCKIAWSANDRLIISCGSIALVADLHGKYGGPDGARFSRIVYSIEYPDAAIVGAHMLDPTLLCVATEKLEEETTRNSHRSVCWQVGSLQGDFHFKESVRLTSTIHSQTLFVRNGQGPFIVAGFDIVAVTRRLVGQHTDWLTGERKYEEATALAVSAGCLDGSQSRGAFLAICVPPLLATNCTERALNVVRRLMMEAGTKMWLECVEIFYAAGQLHLLVSEIPVPPSSVRLDAQVYDAVLGHLLVVSPRALLAALGKWPGHVYSVGALMVALRERLANVHSGVNCPCKHRPEAEAVLDKSALMESLAWLCEVSGDAAASARLLLESGHPRIFQLLNQNLQSDADLRRDVVTQFPALLNLAPGLALDVAVSHSSTFDPQVIVKAVAQKSCRLQHVYLKQLLHANAAAGLHFFSQQMELTAQFEPHALHSFFCQVYRLLSHSQNDGVIQLPVNLTSALDTCRNRGVADAEALLLQRAGSWDRSLQILLRNFGDVQEALRLVNCGPESCARALWDQVAGTALSDSRFFSSLLCAVLSMGDVTAVACLQNFVPPTCAWWLRFGANSLLDVPRLAAKLARIADAAEADRDIRSVQLERLKGAARSVSVATLTVQRRGLATYRGKTHARLNLGSFANDA